MRLFLAMDLPDAPRRDLAAIQADLRARCPGWRWVRPASIHLTMRFLGDVGPELDAASRRSWEEVTAACPAVRLRLGRVGVFQGPSRPRVLWVSASEEPEGEARLESLARGLEQAARALGFLPEDRPFRPHLTLARAAGSERPVPPPAEPRAIGEIFEVGEVVLFRSDLDPSGARYTRLAAYPLGGGA